MERTAIGQVLCIIWLEDGLWETRFLIVYSDPNCIKKDEAIGQRDSRTARTTVEPQEKNIRLGDYIQIRSRPTDKTAEARKRNRLSNP